MGGKRTVVIGGHKTSIFIEDEFWQEFKAIAQAKSLPIGQLVGQIEQQKGETPNLSSAIRLYVLEQVRDRARTAQAIASTRPMRLGQASADGN